MIPQEIISKIRRIEIRTKGLVNDLFGGEYHSVFKGRGMMFSEVREYQPGDDIRLIDWNVSALVGTPFIKIFEEERELTVYMVVDVSGSGQYGTVEKMKMELGNYEVGKGSVQFANSDTWERTDDDHRDGDPSETVR